MLKTLRRFRLGQKLKATTVVFLVFVLSFAPVLPSLHPLMLLGALSSQAAVITWDGGGADNNWSTKENWSEDRIPGPDDIATFSSLSTKDVYIDIDVSVDGIDILADYPSLLDVRSGKKILIGQHGFNQKNGSFKASSAPLEILGSFSLEGGTFIAPTSELSVKGNFVTSGGTYEHNNGTVNLTGTEQLLFGSPTFYNLTKISQIGQTLVIQSGKTITIANTLRLKGSSLFSPPSSLRGAEGDEAIPANTQETASQARSDNGIISNIYNSDEGLLKIRSSTPGEPVILDPRGPTDLAHLDLQDVINQSPQEVTCNPGCLNSGNVNGIGIPSPGAGEGEGEVVSPLPQQGEGQGEGNSGGLIARLRSLLPGTPQVASLRDGAEGDGEAIPANPATSPHLIVKKTPADSDQSFEPGDIIGTYNTKRLLTIHAQNITNPKHFDFNEHGLRTPGTLLDTYLQHAKEFKFERVDAQTVRRINQQTGAETLISAEPNADGEHMDVALYLNRRLKSENHQIFGSPGQEYWYGGSESLTDEALSAIWDAIEAQTDRNRNQLAVPLTPVELRDYLLVPVEDFSDDLAAELTAVESTPGVSGTESSFPSPSVGEGEGEVAPTKRKYKILIDKITPGQTYKLADIIAPKNPNTPLPESLRASEGNVSSPGSGEDGGEVAPSPTPEPSPTVLPLEQGELEGVDPSPSPSPTPFPSPSVGVSAELAEEGQGEVAPTPLPFERLNWLFSPPSVGGDAEGVASAISQKPAQQGEARRNWRPATKNVIAQLASPSEAQRSWDPAIQNPQTLLSLATFPRIFSPDIHKQAQNKHQNSSSQIEKDEIVRIERHNNAFDFLTKYTDTIQATQVAANPINAILGSNEATNTGMTSEAKKTSPITTKISAIFRTSSLLSENFITKSIARLPLIRHARRTGVGMQGVFASTAVAAFSPPGSGGDAEGVAPINQKPATIGRVSGLSPNNSQTLLSLMRGRIFPVGSVPEQSETQQNNSSENIQQRKIVQFNTHNFWFDNNKLKTQNAMANINPARALVGSYVSKKSGITTDPNITWPIPIKVSANLSIPLSVHLHSTIHPLYHKIASLWPSKAIQSRVIAYLNIENYLKIENWKLKIAQATQWLLGSTAHAAGTVTTSIGTRAAENVDISSVTGTGPWTVTLSTAPTNTVVGDTLTDEAATPNIYLITAISGSDLTVRDAFGAGTAPSAAAASQATTTRTYSTITAWEADLDDTGVYASTDDAVGHVYNDSVYDESVTIDGGGTVGLNSVTLTVPESQRHDGTAGTGARVVNSAITTPININVPSGSDNYAVEWLELTRASGGSSSAGFAFGSGQAGKTVTGKNLIVHDIKNTGTASLAGIGYNGSGVNYRLLNTIIYEVGHDSGGTSGTNRGLGIESTVDNRILNTTVHAVRNPHSTGGATGVLVTDDADTQVRNVLSTNPTVGGSGTAAAFSPSSPTNATMSHNASSDSTASGTGSLTNIVTADQYVSTTAGAEDLHLKSGADAIDAGTDLGTTPTGVNLDIDGRNRDAAGDTWDIGADEQTNAVIWDNDGGDNLWSTAANWSTGAVPTSSDVATFRANSSTANVTIDANANVAGIEIQEGYTGTITQNTGITITVGARGWLQEGGTFTGGDSTIDVNGSYTLSGGTFTATSGTFEQGGEQADIFNFTISGGTFNHNSGTVELVLGQKTINIGSATLNNLTVSMFNNHRLYVTGTVDVNGTLTITSVYNFTTTSSGNFNIAGNIVTTDAFLDPLASDPTFTLDGTGDQTIGASGGTGSIKALIINKASGTVTFQDTIKIEGHGWTHTAGTVDMGTSTTIFGCVCPLTTVDDSSTSFNDVEINTANQRLNVTGTMDINGDLTLTSIFAINSGTITLAGNLTSTDTLIGEDATATTITLDGTGTQNIDLDGDGSGNGDLPDGTFTINKTSGTATLTNHATTGFNATGQDLTLTDGILNLAGFNLTVNDVLTASSGSVIELHGSETVTATTKTISDGSTIRYIGDNDAAADSYTISQFPTTDNLAIMDGIDGLVGYWKFDEGAADSCAGGEDACDSSGQGNHGTWSGASGGDNTTPTWTNAVPAAINYTDTFAMDFDGTDDYVSISSAPESKTWHAFAKSDTNGTFIIINHDNDGTWIRNDGSRIRAAINGTFWDWNGFTDDNSWHAFTLVLDGTTGRLYMDGIERSTQTGITAHSGASTLQVGIGITDTFPFNGQIDDVRIYNHALSPAEVAALAGGSQEFATPHEDTFTQAANLDINGTFDLSGGTFAQGAFTLNVAEDFTIQDGTTFTKSSNGSALTLDGDLTYTDNSTTKQDLGDLFIGTSPDTTDLASDMTATSLTVQDGDILNTNGYDLDITNDITIAADGGAGGGTLDATDDVETDTTQINLGGNWTNNGTFTQSDSRVTFDGTSQTIAGSTTFYDLYATENGNDETDDTLTFTAGTTQTVQGVLSLTGTDHTDRLNLRSTAASQWNINVSTPASAVLDLLDIQYSNNTSASNLEACQSLDSGNNTAWDIYSSCELSGTTFSDEGSTALAAKTVAVAVNGTDHLSTVESDGTTGAYSFSSLGITNTDIVTVYLEDEPENAVTITESDGINLANFDLYQDRLITRHDNADVLTNADIATGIVSGESDITDLVSVASGNLTMTSTQDNGLVGYWKFDEGTGTSAADSSGQGNTGTLTGGPTWTTTTPTVNFTNPYALDFDGTDDQTALASELNLTGDFAASVWVNHDNFSARRVFMGGAAGGPFISASSATTIGVRTSEDVERSFTVPAMSTGTWYHVAISSENGSLRVYLNGTESSTGAVSDSGTMQVGTLGTYGASGQFFAGPMDDVRIWDRSISENEVLSLASGNYTHKSELFIPTSHTFTPGGTIDVGDIDINGTLTMASNNATVSGTWDTTGGSFTTSGQTLFAAEDGESETITSNSQSFQDVVVNDGLVGYWKLDETSAGTFADSSGYGNTGTGNGATGTNNTPQPTDTKPTLNFTNPKALDFDGTDDYVEKTSPTNLDVTDTYTFSAWVKAPLPGASGYHMLFWRGITGQSDIEIYVQQTSNDLVITHNRNNGGTFDSVKFVDPQDDTYYHLTVTYSNGAVTAYYNGTPATVVESGPIPAPVATSSHKVRLGHADHSIFTPTFLDGQLDDVRIYNRALSATEISRLANGNQPETSLTTFTLEDTLDVNGDLTLNAGILDTKSAENNAITLAGSWDNNGGIFTPNSNTVTLDGTSGTHELQSGNQQFNNVTISGSGGAWTLHDDLYVGEVLTQSAGTLDTSSTDNHNLYLGNLSQTAGTLTTNESKVTVDNSSNQTLTATSSQYDVHIGDSLKRGLAGYWKLDETAAGTCTGALDACDSSGNANHGTWGTTANSSDASDPTVSTEVADLKYTNARSLDFDGTDDYVSIADNSALRGMSTLTLSAWVNQDVASGEDSIIGYWHSTASLRHYLLRTSGTSIQTFIQTDGTGQIGGTFATMPSTSTWHHLVATWDGSTLRMYINGTLDDTTFSGTGNILNDSHSFSIGDDATTDNWDGKIDDVRIYNRALTTEEIRHMASGGHKHTPSDTATFTLAADLDVEHDLHINDGTLDVSETNYDIEVGGDWLNASTFTGRSGQVILNGEGGQEVTSGGSAFNDLVLNDGLVGYWAFDTGSGSSATDGSGYGNDGTINGATWSASPTNNLNFTNPYALDFDGTDDYVSFASSTPITTTFTVTLWAHSDQDQDDAAVPRLFNFYDSATESTRFAAAVGNTVNNDLLTFYNGSSWVSTGYTFPHTSWKQVTFTYNGTTLKAYVDGTEQYSASQTINVNSTPFKVSGQHLNDENWDGQIDDVRIYNRALSAGEVAELATGNQPQLETQPGMVGYWKFDEGSGTSATDSSGYANTGTLTGGPTYTTTKADLNFTNNFALDFDGTDDYVSMSDNSVLNVSTSFTATAWVRLDTNDGEFDLVYDSGTQTNHWYIGLNGSDKLVFTEAGIQDYVATTSLSTGTWYHAAFVKSGDSGTNVTMYLNGSSDGTASVGSVSTPSGAKRIGWANDVSAGAAFDGQIDDVRIYDRALSANEITSLANGDHPATFTLEDTLDVNGDLTLNAGALDTKSSENNAINLAGSWQNHGGLFTPQSGTVTLDAASGTESILSGSEAFNNLTLNDNAGSATWNQADDLDIDGDFTLTGGTLDASSNNFDILLAGDWANSGTFTPQSGTVTLDGTDQTISGTNTFNNLTKVESADDETDETLTFPASVTTTINGTLTLTGTDLTDRINIVSSTPATAWNISVASPGTESVNFVDLADSNNTSGSNLTACQSVDSGGNTAWDIYTTCAASGIVYSDEGSTAIGADKTVRAAINGIDISTGETGADGTYSIADLTATTDDVLTFYLEDEPENAVTITVTDGINLTGFDLYQDRLIARHDNGGTISNADIATGTVSGEADITDVVEVASGNLAMTSTQDNGLVGYWAFDEGSGSSASDASGNGNTGTLTNSPTYTTTKPTTTFTNPYALDVTGTDDYVSVNDSASLDLTTAMSVSVWVRRTTSHNNHGIVGKWESQGGDSSNSYLLFFSHLTGNAPRFGVNTSGSASSTGTQVEAAAIDVDTWYHVIGTYDGANVRIYVNGTEEDSAAATGSIYTGTSNLQIGTYATTADMNGQLDDVRIYNRALSADEISSLSGGSLTHKSELFIPTTHTFTPGGTIDVGDIDINGTLTLESNDATVSGTWDTTGGAFTTSGQTMFTGTGTESETITSNSQSFQDLVLNDGLVGYWKFDEGSGTSATDSSGYANTGTLENSPTWSASPSNNLNFTNPYALDFAGSGSQRVAISNPDIIGTDTSFTISVWVNNDSFSSLQPIYLETLITNPNDHTRNFLSIGIDGKPSFDQFLPSGGNLISATALSTATWYHIAYTQNGSNRTIYINGVSDASDSSAETYTGDTPDITYIGYRRSSEQYDGQIDDVRIYNRALSATEISRLATGNQPETSLSTYTLEDALDVNGDLTLNTGALSASSATLSVAGTWENSGGILNAGTSTVTLDGTTTGHELQSGNQQFNNITISGSGGAWTMHDDLYVGEVLSQTAGTLDTNSTDNHNLYTGNLSQTAGTLTTNSSKLTIDNSASKTLTATSAQYDLHIGDSLKRGLVGYWKLDETAAGSCTGLLDACDSSGNANHGTWGTTANTSDASDPTVSTDVADLKYTNARSLDFDGTDEYVNIGAVNSQVLTYSAWVRIDSLSSHRAIIGSSTDDDGWEFRVSSAGKLQLLKQDLAILATSTSTVQTQTWQHVAVTHSNNNIEFFIGGSSAGTGSHAQTITENDVWIGARSHTDGGDGTTEEFDGLIDDVRIYNRALNAEEIRHMASGGHKHSPSDTATFTMGGNLDVNNDLQFNDGILDTGSGTNYSINLAGDWNNYAGSGAYVPNTATVTLDGTSQAINGSNSFHNLTKNESANDATDEDLTVEASSTQTVAGTLTLAGRDADDRLNLISSSPGTSYTYDVASAQTVSILDVTDANASTSDITCNWCVNGGNNDDGEASPHWVFNLPLTQSTWRWYADPNTLDVSDPWPSSSRDLDENGVLTVLPAQNDPPQDGDELRIRVNYTLSADMPAGAFAPKIQYGRHTTCSSVSSWTDVGTNGSGADWTYAISDVTDNTAIITTRLSDSDVAGNYIKSASTSGNTNSATSGQQVEWDFHIEHNGATDAASYCFRAVQAEDSATIEAYTSYPQLHTKPGTGDLMRHGNVWVEQTEQGHTWAN